MVSRGGLPRKDKTLPSGSLAERSVRSGEMEYAEADNVAAIAKPVLWKGRLAKVILVTVPWERRSVLEPQLGRGMAGLSQVQPLGGDRRVLTGWAGCPIIKCKTSTLH